MDRNVIAGFENFVAEHALLSNQFFYFLLLIVVYFAINQIDLYILGVS
ncbi:hypothetical protein [uncultured Pedobacter sp.]|nr:hypothetical protein [uncultured Pedobacter sp.]